MQIELKIDILNSHNQNMRPISIAESISQISIDGNDELDSHPNVTGFGTWEQPYIIENYEIGGAGNAGINITNTNKPLIINNCTIENFNYGIWLQNVSNVKIGNNTFDSINGIAGGTGVTAIVAKHLNRNSISIEIDPINIEVINERLEIIRDSDRINKFYSNYIYTENFDKIWNIEQKQNRSKLDNYSYQDIAKLKLNNIFLMKETIKNILINDLKIPENLINFDYRIKDDNNKVHRFELVLNIRPKENIILRLVYGKNIQQADLWIKRINNESEMVKIQEPKSKYYAVLCGIAFKGVISDLNSQINKEIYIPFPSWEKMYQLPSLTEKLNNLNLMKNIKFNRQVSLDSF